MSIANIVLAKLGITKPKQTVDHEALRKERIRKQRELRNKHKANHGLQEAIQGDKALPLATLPTNAENASIELVEGLTQLEQSIYNQYLKWEFQ